MWILLNPVALADDAPVSDDLIRQEVDQAFGKPVPKEAVCIAHPTLPEPFHGAATPVAVKRGSLGCVLLGVVIAGQWYEPAAALPMAIDRTAWDALDTPTRNARLLDWTDHVLLAFVHPTPGALAQVTADKKGGLTVDRRYGRRDDSVGRTADVVTKWSYDPGLLVTATSEQVLSRTDAQLHVRMDHVEGVSEETVDAALTSIGGNIKKCFLDAWDANPAITSHMTLGWTINAGQVGGFSMVTDGDSTDNQDQLAQCYVHWIKSGKYPADANGKVREIFVISQSAVSEPGKAAG